jgi:hypothetical protein
MTSSSVFSKFLHVVSRSEFLVSLSRRRDVPFDARRNLRQLPVKTMRIIRYLDAKGHERYGAEQMALAIELTGDLFSGLTPINRRANVR